MRICSDELTSAHRRGFTRSIVADHLPRCHLAPFFVFFGFQMSEATLRFCLFVCVTPSVWALLYVHTAFPWFIDLTFYRTVKPGCLRFFLTSLCLFICLFVLTGKQSEQASMGVVFPIHLPRTVEMTSALSPIPLQAHFQTVCVVIHIS